jgi:HEAT repeat protein
MNENESGLMPDKSGRTAFRSTVLERRPENAVWKRWLLGTVVTLLCMLVVALAFPATVYIPVGLVRREAFYEGKPTNYWSRAFKQESFLGHAPPSGDIGNTLRNGGVTAVPVLRQLATSPDENVRAEALRVLTFIGPEAKSATPELVAAMKTETNSSRFMLACEALTKADPSAAAETLGEVLRDKTNEGRRSWALTELLHMAPQGREALPAVKGIFSDPHEEVVLRVQAIRILWRLDEPSDPLREALVAVVTADRSPAGIQALEALGEMGPTAKPALAELLKLLNNPRLPATGRHWGPPHRSAVVHAIGSIGPEAVGAVPALLSCLKINNLVLRTEVALALSKIGPLAKETLAVRDAGTWASIALLAARLECNFATLPLVQLTVRTWIPRQEQTYDAIWDSILQFDPDLTPWTHGQR